jgi:hypothetical protein
VTKRSVSEKSKIGFLESLLSRSSTNVRMFSKFPLSTQFSVHVWKKISTSRRRHIFRVVLKTESEGQKEKGFGEVVKISSESQQSKSTAKINSHSQQRKTNVKVNSQSQRLTNVNANLEAQK